MTETATTKSGQAGEDHDGLVQLRFNGKDGELSDLSAIEVAEVLQGLVTFTSDLARAGAFGDGPPPELRVRPPQEGSFIIEAIVHWAQMDPTGFYSSMGGTGLAVIQGLRVVTKGLRAQVKDSDYLENGMVKLTYQDDTIEEVPEPVWRELKKKKRRTKKALQQILSPLGGDDAAVLELRDGQPTQDTEEVQKTTPELVLERTDFQSVAKIDDDVEENTLTFDVEAQLRGVDFRPGQKWRIKVQGQPSRQAVMEDDEFLSKIDGGHALHKDDIMDVTIRENSTVKNGRLRREWAIVKVRHTRRGGGDGDDEPSSGEPSSAA